MDPAGDALRRGIAAVAFDPGTKEHAEALNCLKTSCQRVIGQCRADRGPCSQVKQKREAMRACRPLKKTIMTHFEDECSGNANKMLRRNSKTTQVRVVVPRRRAGRSRRRPRLPLPFRPSRD